MPSMIPNPITITKFPGMNNTGRQSLLPIVLNMDATPDKRLIDRDGFTSAVTLPGVRAMTSDGVYRFCVATGSASPESIYKISPDGIATEISAINGLGDPMFYVIMKDKIFMSSKSWSGVYVYATNTIRAWGAAYSDDPETIDGMYSSEQLITLNVIAAPNMENLCLAGARIWGSVGNRAYYNDPPLAFEMYRPDTFHPFTGSDLTMIAATAEGMYFANEDITYFGMGLDPETMVFTIAGDGALKGSLQYLPNSRKYGNNVPIWTGKRGIFVGVGGKAVPLTLDLIKFSGTGQAASMIRSHNGATQYISNFILPSSDTEFQDEATVEVFRNGELT